MDLPRTIKFMDIVNDGLDGSAITSNGFEQTQFLRLSLKDLENNGEREEEDRLNNGKNTETPTPSRLGDDSLGEQRASEGSADEWCAAESKSKSSVLQSGSIGNEDIQDEVQSTVANIEQDVSCCVTVGTIACRHDDDADDVDGEEDQKAFSTAPDVEDLGNW